MIDADNGNIHLPNGFVITPALTLKEFQESWFGRNAGINRPASTPKQCRFHESAGIAAGYSFSVGLSFQEQALTRVSLVCETPMEDDADDEFDGV